MINQTSSLHAIGTMARESAALSRGDKEQAVTNLLVRLRSAPRLMTALGAWLIQDVQTNPNSVFCSAKVASALSAAQDAPAIRETAQPQHDTQWRAGPISEPHAAQAVTDGTALSAVDAQLLDGRPVNQSPIGETDPGYSPISDTSVAAKAATGGTAPRTNVTQVGDGRPVNQSPIGGRGQVVVDAHVDIAPTSDTQGDVKTSPGGTAQKGHDTHGAHGRPVTQTNSNTEIGGRDPKMVGTQGMRVPTSEPSVPCAPVHVRQYERSLPGQATAKVDPAATVQVRQHERSTPVFGSRINPPPAPPKQVHKPMDLASAARVVAAATKSFMETLILEGRPFAYMTAADVRNMGLRSARNARFAALAAPDTVPDSMIMMRTWTEDETRVMWRAACQDPKLPANALSGITGKNVTNEGVVGHA